MNLMILCWWTAGEPGLRVRARTASLGVELSWCSPLPLCVFNTIAHRLGNRLRQGFEKIRQSGGARYFREKQTPPSACDGCADTDACQAACVLCWRAAGLAELGAPCMSI